MHITAIFKPAFLIFNVLMLVLQACATIPLVKEASVQQADETTIKCNNYNSNFKVKYGMLKQDSLLYIRFEILEALQKRQWLKGGMQIIIDELGEKNSTLYLELPSNELSMNRPNTIPTLSDQKDQDKSIALALDYINSRTTLVKNKVRIALNDTIITSKLHIQNDVLVHQIRYKLTNKNHSHISVGAKSVQKTSAAHDMSDNFNLSGGGRSGDGSMGYGARGGGGMGGGSRGRGSMNGEPSGEPVMRAGVQKVINFWFKIE